MNKQHPELKDRKEKPAKHPHCASVIDRRAAVQHSVALCQAPYFDNVRGSDLSVPRDQFETLATKTAN